MGHKDDSGKTFGPGHAGWWFVRWAPYVGEELRDGVEKNGSGQFFGRVKAKSAFQAAAHFGKSLTQTHVHPIENETLVWKLNNGTLSGQVAKGYK